MMNRALQRFLLGLMAMLLAACGALSPPPPSVGRFIDEPVGGLTYSCGSLINTTAGTTNKLGQFEYYPGKSCTFSVGKVTVGTVSSVPNDGNVTPQDIAGVQRTATNDPTVAVIAQFLQSLNDGTVSGAINISSSTTASLSNTGVASVKLVTSSGPITQEALNNLVVTIAGVPLVSAAHAAANLSTQLSTAGISTSIGAVTASNSPTLHSITVTSNLTSNAMGLSEQLVATGNFTDGSSSVMTNSVTWSSSDATTIQVTANGLATGLRQGAASITATQGSLSASFSLTVTPATLASISVTPGGTDVASGLTRQLVANGTYTDGTSKVIATGLTWSSSSAAVASVDTATGLATGRSPGATSVTATVGSIAGMTTLNVTAAVLQSITLTAPASSVAAGLNEQLAATGIFSDGSAQLLTTGLAWASSTNYSAVTRSGVVTGISAGDSTITASMNGISGSVRIVTTAAVLQSIAITPVSPSIAAGLTTSLVVTGSYSDGSLAHVASGVSWTSASLSIANVVSTGVATGIGRGVATLTASVGSISSSVTLTVLPPVISSIRVSPPSASLPKGLTQAMTATATYSDGSQGTLSSGVGWTSSTPNVATVSGTGVLTGQSVGSTTLTATVSSISGTTTLNVIAAILQSIAVSAPDSSVAAGLSEQLTATGIYSDNSTLPLTTSVTWASSTNYASVSSQGVVAGNSIGNSTITATLSGITGSVRIATTAAVLQSIAITPTGPSVAAGYTTGLAVTGSYSDGSQDSITSGVSWTSANPGVATVNSTTGVATGVAQNSVVITASTGGVTASRTLTVTAPLLQSISITAATSSAVVGATDQLTAIGTYSDGSTQNLTSSITWETTAAASISNAGLVTGVTAGSATITATLNGVSKSMAIPVTLPAGIASASSISVVTAN